MRISNLDKIIANLSDLYYENGYNRYNMSKFEEYELYARNKDFLISENVLTFTDVSGKLMALKPDVTLSIIKNASGIADISKVYYDESVYRVAKGSNSFREIRQLGLECFGNVDDYMIAEVIKLATLSLEKISNDCYLSVSNMDILTGILDADGVSSAGIREILAAIGNKSMHEMELLCQKNNVSESSIELLRKLVGTYGKAANVLAELETILGQNEAFIKLRNVVSAIGSEKINIDFSVVSDISYYNGIVFKGYVMGVPESVITGGQYDKLMKRLHRTDRALGFALYVDALEFLSDDNSGLDADVVIKYDDNAPIGLVIKTADEAKSSANRVSVLKEIPEGFKYTKLIEIKGEKVTTDA